MALGEPRKGERHEHDPDRHVDPEDPVPGGGLDDRAADERTERDGDSADSRPHADGDAAALRGESLGEQGERKRRDDRRPQPLGCPRGDQDRGRGGNCGGCRREGEQGQAGREHAFAAEAVTERRAGQQEDCIGEDVRVDGPLELLDRGVQVAVDAGQRHVYDQVVEHDHEQAERDDCESPSA